MRAESTLEKNHNFHIKLNCLKCGSLGPREIALWLGTQRTRGLFQDLHQVSPCNSHFQVTQSITEARQGRRLELIRRPWGFCFLAYLA